MESSLPLSIWTLRISSYTFWSLQCPGTFQHFVNDTFREYLDDFMVAYLDDLLIYSNTLKEHKRHVRLVLQRLQDAGRHLKLSKYAFQRQIASCRIAHLRHQRDTLNP